MIFSDLFPKLQPTDWKEKHIGLGRMTELMRRLGNPQKKMRFVHVAGTNGKGSVCAMLSSILTASKIRTGLFISPHLCRMNERIRVNGEEISDHDLATVAQQVRSCAAGMDDAPTAFEQITAMGLTWFWKQRCELVILEVGMGGRLDATNIIDSPEVAVICHIGLDHTEFLGNTLEKIAAEKAGIIKDGCRVVLLAQSPEVESVVREKCTQCHAALTVTDSSTLRESLSGNLNYQILDYREQKRLPLSLLGTYQSRNAAAALDTVRLLKIRGFSISEEAIHTGLRTVTWPGRFEILRSDPLFLLDGAHNPDGIRELTVCLDRYLPGRKLIFVMGVMADKDYRTMLRLIAPYAEKFITVTPPNGRSLPSDVLKNLITAETQVPVLDSGTPEKGVVTALRECGPHGAVCTLGSLYQICAVRAIFGRR